MIGILESLKFYPKIDRTRNFNNEILKLINLKKNSPGDEHCLLCYQQKTFWYNLINITAIIYYAYLNIGVN